MGNAWKRAVDENRAMVAEIVKRIDAYSYESPELSKATEEAIFSFARECMNRVRESLHNVMDLGFELHKDDLADKARNAMDVASGIESRTSGPQEWERLPMEFLKKLILKDSIIVLGAGQIADEAEELDTNFNAAMNGDYAKALPSLRRELDSIAQSLDSLYSVLREREKLRDVRADQMKKAAETMDEE